MVRINRFRIFEITRKTLPVVCITIALLACQSAELRTSPPEGVPDTPYWFSAGDSVLWYMPEESLLLAQMSDGATAAQKSDLLYKLRDLGWRMTVNRGPALRRPNDEQDLGQLLFQLERTDGAVSPATRRSEWRDLFWSGGETDNRGALVAAMTAVRLHDDTIVSFLWPGCLTVVWNMEPTADEAMALLDSLDCELITTSQHKYSYYVHKSWSIRLPVGAELFDWLRLFNSDSRVRLAIPITSGYDPPSADQRLMRELKGNEAAEPVGFAKLAEPVKRAYSVAHFGGTTQLATISTKIPSKFDLFRLIVSREETTATADDSLIARLKAELVSSNRYSMDMWVPYASIPDLARESAVTEVRPGRREK